MDCLVPDMELRQSSVRSPVLYFHKMNENPKKHPKSYLCCCKDFRWVLQSWEQRPSWTTEAQLLEMRRVNEVDIESQLNSH